MFTERHNVKYVWSGHATRRWAERFQGVDCQQDFANCRPIGRKARAKIKKLTPHNAKKYMHGFRGRYFLLSRSNIVYVIASGGTLKTDMVVTVFHINGQEICAN